MESLDGVSEGSDFLRYFPKITILKRFYSISLARIKPWTSKKGLL